MLIEEYPLVRKPPCRAGDTVRVGSNFYRVVQMEPLYYEYRARNSAGIEIGFNTGKYRIGDLTPDTETIYYLTGFGIEGSGIEVMINFPVGKPRFTTAGATQWLDSKQAGYLKPFRLNIAMVSGSNLEIDVNAEISGIKCAVWFYGWKLSVQPVKTAASPIQLEDIREVSVSA